MKRILTTALATIALSIAVGCGQSNTADAPPTKALKPADKTAPASKTPPKGDATLPPGHPPITPPSADMSQQTLPPGAMAVTPNPTWAVPKDWKEGKISSMRRGSWVATGAEGQSADIAVTVFPGDVGGHLANVNRWRGQIGLPPVDEAKANEATITLEFNGLTTTIVDFSSDTQRMIVATIRHEGNSWFVKMTGGKAVVEAQKAAFDEFVKSIKF